MKVKEVTYSLSYTIPRPDKDYASFKPMMSMTAELTEDDVPTEALGVLKDLVKSKLESHCAELYKQFLPK